MATAREVWTRLESVHAVTYFAPESRAAATGCGLRGFWMGYFGFRAAPLGEVGPDVVTAAFANFAPAMVARAIPDVWARATPAELLAARRTSAADALRRVAPEAAPVDAAVVASLHAAVDAIGTGAELPLFAANRSLPPPADPVESLWQLCTTLREHRGDAHVRALRAAGLEGCASHVLFVAEQVVPAEVLRDNRGWTVTEWDATRAALVARGLLTATGDLTAKGRAVRVAVEAETDARAGEAFVGLDTDALVRALDPPARAVVTSGLLPFPNPMGLPHLGDARTG